MKKLCFGSYATVLTLCKAQNTSQKVLCGTILLTVAPTYDIRTDDTAVSNLVRCERNLSPNVTDVAPTVNARDVANQFAQTVLPLLDPNKRALIILTLKDIIESDMTIEPDTPVEKVNGMTKATIMNRDSFVLADFLAGIFLYTISVKNRDGAVSIREITEEYIQGFSSRKHEVGFVTKYANFIMETADELAPDPHLITLLTESGGKCCKCGRPLAIKKNGNDVYYGKVVPLSESDDIVLCVDCERELQTATSDEKRVLIADKRELENRVIAMDSLYRINLERQIEEVLREVDQIEDTGDFGLKTDPVKVERKITEPRLRDKTLFYVTRLYEAVNSALDRMAGENKLNVDKFAKNIRRMYEDASEILTSQSEIYNLLVTNLYDKTGRKYREACEIIISYFVQRCEVFDEITE